MKFIVDSEVFRYRHVCVAYGTRIILRCSFAFFELHCRSPSSFLKLYKRTSAKPCVIRSLCQISSLIHIKEKDEKRFCSFWQKREARSILVQTSLVDTHISCFPRYLWYRSIQNFRTLRRLIESNPALQRSFSSDQISNDFGIYLMVLPLLDMQRNSFKWDTWQELRTFIVRCTFMGMHASF